MTDGKILIKEASLPAGASRERLEKAIAGHVLGKTVLTGTRRH